MLQRVKKFFTLENTTVLIILFVALVLRIYRVDDILAFHYDQGRDALVIWDLVNEPHKFFLIGPTTGLAGIFRGPFYYYLIAPLYFFGAGNPVWPAAFLAFTSVAALYLMYKLAREIGGSVAGIIALILGSFSFEIIYASRWLSNPTPMLLLSMLLVYSMFRIYEGKRNYWVLLSLVTGLSFFNFGSSGELFYFPVIFALGLWSLKNQGFGKVKSTLNWKIIAASLAAFFITVAPLLLFNFRHGGLLGNNVGGLVGGESGFIMPTWRFIDDRGGLLVSYFSALIFHSPFSKESIHLLLLFISVIYLLPKIAGNAKTKILIGFILSLTVGLMFYRGNNGNLYAYYLTGYYLIFLILLSFIFAAAFKVSFTAKILVVYFLSFFVIQNWMWIRPYVTTTGQKPNEIILLNQKAAINWVYKEAGSKDFNVDVYVPPVISHSYNYLFKWMGSKIYNKFPSESQVPLLYTVYESDPDHKERLEAWLARQKGIGTVVKSETFGGITVEERTRIITK